MLYRVSQCFSSILLCLCLYSIAVICFFFFFCVFRAFIDNETCDHATVIEVRFLQFIETLMGFCRCPVCSFEIFLIYFWLVFGLLFRLLVIINMEVFLKLFKFLQT